MFGEHGSKQEDERGTKKRRTATAGAGMYWGVFGEVTGASRESVLAEDDCADVVATPRRRITWETLNLIYCISVSSAPLHLQVAPHPPIAFCLTNTHK